ncbi:hypothetical protein MKEN_00562300 [Mycena kentingensis (nom. inval.)]|nr:hypothetical protein MKEN_00562300 [Mycena kentingensis (nom. inval.)]
MLIPWPGRGAMKNHFVQAVDRARQGFKRTRSDSVVTAIDLVLPPELWLHIFAYLSAPWDIRSLTLTCHAFRRLAQPLLFAKICTHPLPSLGPLSLVGLTAGVSGKYRRKVLQRLEFFFSPHIAPAVREVWVDPPSAEAATLPAADDEELPTDVVIDTIFDGLRKFPNLATLVCKGIRLTPRRVAVLQQLPLTTITLDSCPSDVVDIPPELPAIPLSTVALRYPSAPLDAFAVSESASLPSAALLSLFLSPKHLTRVSATSSHLLPVLLGSARAFTKLPEGAIPRVGTPSIIPSSTLPALRFYRGPRNFAVLFARSGGRLATVEISVPAKAHRLERTIKALPRGIESLSFRVDGEVPRTLFAAVHARFAALKTLSMNDPALSCTALHNLLPNAEAPAPTLRVLRLRIEGKDRYNLWVPPLEEAADAVECFEKVKERLGKAYPGLVTVKFMYGVEGASIVWKRSGGSGTGTKRELVRVTPL